MALTLTDVQKALVTQLGPFLDVAGLDGVTQDTPNLSMQDAIGRAITSSGGTVASPPEITDSDIATITAGWYRFTLLAQYHLLDTIWGNWPYVDQKDGDTSQSLNQLAERLTKKQEAIMAGLKDPELLAALKVPGPPRIAKIIAGSRGGMTPFNPFAL